MNLIQYTLDNKNINFSIIENEIWATQKQIAELFGVDRTVITKHLQNIFDDGELDEKATCSKIAQVQIEGNRSVTREIEHYKLDVIISVGYRINSTKATQFRIWATKSLKELIRKGYVINKQLLENSETHANAFELTAKELRTSDQTISQKLNNIFRDYSSNYYPNSTEIQEFFAIYQNIIHYASTGQTASEIIVNRANAKKENMGLITWKNENINKVDVHNAKNYLNEFELSMHQNVLNMFLSYSDVVKASGKKILMNEWLEKLKGFIKLAELQLLENKGSVTSKQAEKHANSQYEIFKPIYRKELKEKPNQMSLI